MTMIDTLPLPGGAGVLMNASGIYTDEIIDAVMANDVVMGQVMRFTTEIRNARPNRKGTFADRDRYLRPNSVYEQIRTARIALHDDIVSGVAEETEALAFTDCSMSCNDEDQEDVWNQIAGDMDLDGMLRIAWSMLFSDSQFIAATWWTQREYTVRGTTAAGRARRKKAKVTVPEAVTFLDTTRITPVGELMWGRERLCYIATEREAQKIEAALARPAITPLTGAIIPYGHGLGGDLLSEPDHVLRTLIRGRYTPSEDEMIELQEDGVHDHHHLFEFNPDYVWRHSLTRPQFQRFSRVRMTSVFELLDLKNLLHQMDRAHLIGGANFIVLVTKGSDKIPADQTELRNLRENAQLLGSTPIVTGDHRLKVEIITANVEITINKERYDTLDQRIAARLYQAIMPTQPTADPMKVARLVASGLESRRKMLRRAIEREVIDRVRRKNPGFFTDRATMVFSPESIQLSFDPAWANALLDLSDGRHISRDTLLRQFGMSQQREMALRIREAGGEERLLNETKAAKKAAPGSVPITELAPDDVFKSPSAPPGAAAPAAPGATDRQAARSGGRRKGGTKAGGGAAPGTNQGGARQNQPEDPRKAASAIMAMAELAGLEVTVHDSDGDDA